MKKFGLSMGGIALVTLVAASSQAALISSYTFDDTPNNAVAGRRTARRLVRQRTPRARSAQRP